MTQALNFSRVSLLLKYCGLFCCLIVSATLPQSGLGQTEKPPYRGTIFDFPELMRESDPTAFVAIRHVGQGERNMFDRRIDRFQTSPVFLFEATFHDQPSIEIAVNREFAEHAISQKHAEFYATAFGRLPLMLRSEIEALHIQAGKKLFGGGRKLLIHVEQGEEYHRDGILEETLGHEAAHALDAAHARHDDWVKAQKDDDQFISSYAQENPSREDIAESIIPYFAIRFRPDRISQKHRQTIQATIPARMQYFDSLNPAPFPSGSEALLGK